MQRSSVGGGQRKTGVERDDDPTKVSEFTEEFVPGRREGSRYENALSDWSVQIGEFPPPGMKDPRPRTEGRDSRREVSGDGQERERGER